MIYVYAEGSKEGFTLLKNAINTYLKEYNILTNTICGIANLANHIKNHKIGDSDYIYYIYDDIQENIEVIKSLDIARKVIIQRNISDRVKLIPILCAEYSLLSAKDIEYFVRPHFLYYIYELKKYTVDGNITKNTKQNPYFKDLYNDILKEKLNEAQRIQQKYAESYIEHDIEKFVTIEKLCKKLFNKIFTNELSIEYNLNNCWTMNCCFKKTKICSMKVGEKTRKLTGIEKKQFLVDNTAYIKIVEMIASEHNLKLIKLARLTLNDLTFSKQANKAIEEYKNNTLNIKKCISNLETYILNMKYTSKEAEELCKKDGFEQCILDKAKFIFYNEVIDIKNKNN